MSQEHTKFKPMLRGNFGNQQSRGVYAQNEIRGTNFYNDFCMGFSCKKNLISQEHTKFQPILEGILGIRGAYAYFQ